MDVNRLLNVTFKFGGFWRIVQNTERKKYEGGKQRTVKMNRDLFSWNVIISEIEGICPWLRGCCYELFHHIHGTSPKEYKAMKSEDDCLELLREIGNFDRVEIIIALENMPEEQLISDIRPLNQVLSSTDIITDVVTDTQLSIGTCFHDSAKFREFLRSKAITENFGLKITASDRKRVIAICSHRGCPWRIRASLCMDGQTFEVRKYEASHLCPGVNRAGNKQATSSWVANEIQEIVKKQPDIAPKVINSNLETTYGLSLPYMKLWRSREIARDIVFGVVDDNYKWVPALRAELLTRNPGSHVLYTYSGVDNSFMRFYVSFKVSIEGFVMGCRHLIGLDACHLKSKYLGVLLSANTLDGDNGLFTIAFAVVESESGDTWNWFLEQLVLSFGFEITPMAFISDMEKGLEQAIKNVFPDAEHRICIRHLWKNIKKYFHCQESQKLRNTFWAAANAFTSYEYEKKMIDLFNISPELHSYLVGLPYKWSKYTFNPAIKNHYNTNNMAESFNSWIAEARLKPAVDLVVMIRGMLMEQRFQRKMNAARWRGELVPFAEEYIRDVTTRKENFIVRQSAVHKAEVEGIQGMYEVDIESRVCGCRYWQISGLPCIHAAAFIGTKEFPLWHIYVDEYYYTVRYRMAYEGAISTLPGKEQWDTTLDDTVVVAPNTLRPRGRPRKSRFKSFLENTTTKMSRIHKCSRCGAWGHHKNTCKNPLSQSTSENPRNFRQKLPIRRDTQ